MKSILILVAYGIIWEKEEHKKGQFNSLVTWKVSETDRSFKKKKKVIDWHTDQPKEHWHSKSKKSKKWLFINYHLKTH